MFLLVLACGCVFGQSWQSGRESGFISVDFSKVGSEYTIVLHNLTGTTADTNTNGWDILVWSLEPFNLPAPQSILQMPTGWVWTNTGFEAFEVESQSDKYKTPPSLAPGGSYTFKYISDLTDPANSGGPANDVPGFLCHVAAVDSSNPGSATQKWTGVTPEGFSGPTWHERAVVPEPGSLLALATGFISAAGLVVRRRI
jgi:hypothetical protein